MSNHRVYTTYFDNVTVAAVQDLFSLKASTSVGIEIHEIQLSAGAVTTPAEIRIRLKRAPVTLTQGSGGTTPTLSPWDSGNAKSAGVTGHVNDTTQATTTGTMVILAVWQWNVLVPFQFLPTPEDRPACAVSEGFILDIAATPASTVVSGWIAWEEYP